MLSRFRGPEPSRLVLGLCVRITPSVYMPFDTIVPPLRSNCPRICSISMSSFNSVPSIYSLAWSSRMLADGWLFGVLYALFTICLYCSSLGFGGGCNP